MPPAVAGAEAAVMLLAQSAVAVLFAILTLWRMSPLKNVPNVQLDMQLQSKRRAVASAFQHMLHVASVPLRRAQRIPNVLCTSRILKSIVSVSVEGFGV